ncbi:PadR, Transcriptional regulator PadR-like family, partial [mine drainage metagenome]
MVGTYALYMMSRGPIYGGELTQRIDDVTRGSWRPGAGAIYPILSGLVRRGEARLEVRDGRKVYSLTARGAARLKEVRSRIRERGGRFAELRGLILDMVE